MRGISPQSVVAWLPLGAPLAALGRAADAQAVGRPGRSVIADVAIGLALIACALAFARWQIRAWRRGGATSFFAETVADTLFSYFRLPIVWELIAFVGMVTAGVFFIHRGITG